MKTIIVVVLSIILGLIGGYFIHKIITANKKGPDGITVFQETIRVKQLHLVKHVYQNLIIFHKKNDASKKIRAIGIIPAKVSAFVNLKDLRFSYNSDSTLSKIIVPGPQIDSPINFIVENMQFVDIPEPFIKLGKDQIREFLNVFQERITEEAEKIKRLAIGNDILGQTKSECKDYIKSLLDGLNLKNVIIEFAETDSEVTETIASSADKNAFSSLQNLELTDSLNSLISNAIDANSKRRVSISEMDLQSINESSINELQKQKKMFNSYLLRAVDTIEKYYSLKGYSKGCAYTHDLSLGNFKLKATCPSLTMCVAAQMEIIVIALNIYISETYDNSCIKFLGGEHWKKANRGSLKDLIWVNAGSSGTADGLAKFGMGEVKSFKELEPGSFINLNREKTGHAVLFISYINAKGEEVKKYSEEVKGFKYYSSQGSIQVGKGGFGYRYAFFDKFCPTLDATKKRDCGVIYSSDQKYLNCGIMFTPQFWDSKVRDKRLRQLDGLENIGSMKENEVNQKYLEQNTTDN